MLCLQKHENLIQDPGKVVLTTVKNILNTQIRFISV